MVGEPPGALAVCPFGPWRRLRPGEPSSPPTGLPEPLGELAPIYEAMGRLGWSVTEADEMELWQVARFLGVEGEPIIRGSQGLQLASDSDEYADLVPPPRYELPDEATWGTDVATLSEIDALGGPSS